LYVHEFNSASVLYFLFSATQLLSLNVHCAYHVAKQKHNYHPQYFVCLFIMPVTWYKK
jgi:hypothetical protein